MAIPGFQELLESRIKKYFVCTARLVRGYNSKNYFIPPLATETYISSTHLRSKRLPGKS